MENIKLSPELVNAILGYLGNRPYAEVYQLIEAINQATAAQYQPESKQHKGK